MRKWLTYRAFMKACGFSLLILLITHGLYSVYVYLQPSPFQDQDAFTVEGVIVDIPHMSPLGVSFLLSTHQGLLKLNWYQQKLMLTPGQKWQLQVKLKNMLYFANPGEFNYERYLKQQNIQGLGYIIDSNQDQLLGFSQSYTLIDYWRFLWYQRLLVAMQGLPTKAILLALILGDKTQLNTVDWQSFERTGTSYFMVISGLHIVLFAAMGALIMRYCWALFPRLALKIPAKQMGLATGLIFGLVYGVMAGALVPTQRAVLMLLFVGLAKLFLRSISSMRALALAFIIIVIWNPLIIFSVAFWMSFIAVFFLIFCFSDRLGKLKLWQEWLQPQWLMFWVLMPVSIYTFNQFAGIAILTNLIAMPMMLFMVIPNALIGAFLIWISPLAGALMLKLSNYLMLKLVYLLHYFAAQNWWGMWVAQISFLNMLLGLIGTLIIFMPKGIPGRWLGWLMFIPILWPMPLMIASGQIRIISLKTQNIEAKMWITHNHVILLQTINDMRAIHGDISHIIEAYCLHEGIHKIDLWIVNLKGNYHNVQVLQQDMGKINVGKIAVNHRYKIYDSQLLFCGATYPWLWDGVRFNLVLNQEKTLRIKRSWSGSTLLINYI